MAIELSVKYAPYVDEMFTKESKISLLTNDDFELGSAATVKIYKISTAEMNDYGRNTAPVGDGIKSHYGIIQPLNATTEEMKMTKDRSFTFVIDRLDNMETEGQLAGATALARQVREVVIPEVDTYTYGVIAENAGTKPEAVAITSANVYEEILKASQELDDNFVPEDGRVLVVTPNVYRMMKLNSEIIMGDVGAEDRKKGVIGTLDGAKVLKLPESRLPENFGFMMVHPCATVAPKKLEDYVLHENPPGISGTLVEGRIVYDAFVFENKAKAIYYQETTTA